MKKKCIFFIQGEGRGHCAQALALKQIFDEIGIDVVGVYIGKNHLARNHDWVLKDINVATTGGYYSPNFVYHNNEISLTKTVLKTIKNVKNIVSSIKYIKDLVKLHNPDFVINFYEPLVGRALLNHSVPVIVIGHQFMIPHPLYPKQLPIQRFLIQFFNHLVAGTAVKKIALSYYPQYDTYNITVCPPLLRRDILQSNIVIKPNKVVAYVVNSYLVEKITNQAHLYPDKQFVIYNETYSYVNKNVECKKVGPSFVTDLLSAEYVITSGGFETICESVYLNKKILAVPVENHAEQILNTIDASTNKLICTNDDYNLKELFESNVESTMRNTSKLFMQNSVLFYKQLFENL